MHSQQRVLSVFLLDHKYMLTFGIIDKVALDVS